MSLRRSFLFGVFLWACASGSFSEEVSREQIKGLDEQVQDIKKDVLGISAELTQLEEKLIYPSNTQVSVFVSFEEGTKFRLDAVKLKLDGKDVAHHIYAFKELEALQGGGVQRIYTGNIKAGEHTLDVSIKSKTSGKTLDLRSGSHKFTKSVEPRLIEVVLGGADQGGQRIAFRD